MTILIGVLCKNGVIIGSDSVATCESGPNNPTMELGPVRKIEIIENKIITATTGSIGLSQRYISILTRLTKQGIKKKDEMKFATDISHEVIADFQNTPPFSSHPYQGWGLGALLGFSIDDNFYLVEFDVTNFRPEFKNKRDLPIVSMGLGQRFADPFLAFLWKDFLKGEEISLEEGILVACWALEHTLKVNYGMIGGDKKISLLTKNSNKDIECRNLSQEEIMHYSNHIIDIMTYISNYKKEFISLEVSSSLPTPPLKKSP
jgi:20S proteasome alpha/beta subunit